MSIPGLDLLLKATGSDSQPKSSSVKLWPTPAQRSRDAGLRQHALEPTKGDLYRSDELTMKPALSNDRDKLPNREEWGGKQDNSASWWREDTTQSSTLFDAPNSSPLFDQSGSREATLSNITRELLFLFGHVSS